MLFEIGNNNLITANSNMLLKNGSSYTINQISDLDYFYSGIGMFNSVLNSPTDGWNLVIAGGDLNTCTQLAYNIFSKMAPKIRVNAAGVWGSWSNLIW